MGLHTGDKHLLGPEPSLLGHVVPSSHTNAKSGVPGPKDHKGEGGHSTMMEEHLLKPECPIEDVAPLPPYNMHGKFWGPWAPRPLRGK